MMKMKEAASEFLALQRIAVTGSRETSRGTGATLSTNGSGTVAMRCSQSTPTPTQSRATPAIRT